MAPGSPPSPWRSLDDLGASELHALVEAEFPSLTAMARVNRRDVLRLMGAALTLAGLAGCGPSARTPLLSRPREAEGSMPGEPLQFATSVELDGYGRGVLVVAHDGRPVKIEGNPVHPSSLGATDPFMQAEVLSLYDPDRSREPRQRGEARTWADVRRWLAAQRQAIDARGGEGTHVLIGACSSPSVLGALERLRRAWPSLRVHTYSPVSDPFRPRRERVHRFDEVDAVLALDADFLGAGPAQVRYARDWIARRRRADLPGPRLFVAEPTPTLTGADADERLPMHPDDLEPFAYQVAAALGVIDGETSPVARRIADALRSRRGLLLVGGDANDAVHALADRINARLGRHGLQEIAPVRLAGAQGLEPLSGLLDALARGTVERLLVLDANPAYDVPGFASLAARVPESLHLGLHRDETASACAWHVPAPHVLERWGDVRAHDGTVGLQQPATEPLVAAHSPLELLALLGGEAPDGRVLVRRQWSTLDDEAWLAALENGVVDGTAIGSDAAVIRDTATSPGRAATPRPASAIGSRPLTVVFRPDARAWDGRYANNAWLQELPQPLSKLVWGNAALLAPATAERLGVADGDVVAVERGGVTVEIPAWRMPGQAPDVVTLTLGHGRRAAGRVGDGVGVNVYPLRAPTGDWRLSRTGGRGRLVSTQRHQPLGPGAPGRSRGPRPDFYPAYAPGVHAWGMTIDLDACIGCGTCTIACQAENNVPVVGPDEVHRGREMHWIRVDRYHAGPPDRPETFFQPVPCMHCEQAPCEVVCPVGATVHSREGLNQMVYNRCIGTRTCSNNCPYKVRRFNWYDYATRPPRMPAGAHNPRVTARGRGVMEKCTYCVQRIEAVRARARVAGRLPSAGEVVTACQQACPTNAIAFGDLANAAEALVRWRQDERHYALLDELNTRPRTTYLARTRRGGDA